MKTYEASSEMRKTSVRLPASLLDDVREAVERGDAKTQTEFMQQALRHELQALRRKRLRSAYQAASNDEAFMRDMEATTRDFEVTSSDGLQ